VILNNSLLSAWSYALVSISYLFLFLKISHITTGQLKKEALKPLVMHAVLATVLWGVFSFSNSIFKIYELRKVAGFFDFLRYFLWCYFFSSIISIKNNKTTNYYTTFLWLLSAVFSASFFFNEDEIEILCRLIFSVFSLVLIEQFFFGVEGDVKWKIKPLSIGLSSIYIFDLYIFSEDVLFNKVDSDVSAIRGLVHALIVPLLFVSMASRARNNFRFKLSKNSAFHTISLTLTCLYLTLISSVGYYVKFFGGTWGQSLQVAIVYLSLLVFSVILFSNNFRSRVEVYISKNFFHYLFDYREEWLKFTNILVEKDLNVEMGQQILKGFSNILDSPSGSLWMQKSKDAAFNQVAQLNQMHTHLSENSESSFCDFMRRTGWVIDIDQYRLIPEMYEGIKLPNWLDKLTETWLVVPLLVGDEMIGFCTLDKARNPVGVNWEVNDLLKMAGRQAAGFLTQMQATEALLEARKFAAFNRMSAFVVHDLKNIVTQLSLMMRNSQRLMSNSEFQKDMLLTVDNSLVRMRQLMLQLREGAPLSVALSGVELVTVIRRLESAALRSGRKIDMVLSTSVLALGQEERVERVLGHLVQNALDATDEGGSVQLTLDVEGEHAHIVLCDSGKGMTPEFLSTGLFKPFQTTKPHGMGLGAYESALYIQELGGRLEVESTLGVGTTIKIWLPLFESMVPATFQMQASA
jgi:putative PEP-CTERM system histidine kinase